VLSVSCKIQGGNDEVLQVRAGGSRQPPSHKTLDDNHHFMEMGGNKIFKFAVLTIADVVEASVKPYGYDDLGVIIPHQMNQRIMEAAAERIGISPALFFSNISKYGNTAAASIPIALDEAIREQRCVEGKLVCMVAFGGGLSWGHALLRW
jgi:3-oxoacyl-[acyl-carrier-protein] synthase-3